MSDVETVRAELLSYLRKELDVEQTLELWRLLFPRNRKIWFDEETERFYYEPMQAVPVEEG